MNKILVLILVVFFSIIIYKNFSRNENEIFHKISGINLENENLKINKFKEEWNYNGDGYAYFKILTNKNSISKNINLFKFENKLPIKEEIAHSSEIDSILQFNNGYYKLKVENKLITLISYDTLNNYIHYLYEIR